jgi:uncharacterized protein (TIGR03067 family)
MIQRGFAVPAGLIAANGVPHEASAALPAALVDATVRTAMPIAAGRAVLVTSSAAALLPVTLRSLLMIRVIFAMAVLATATVVTAVSLPFIRPSRGAGPSAAFQDKGTQQPAPKSENDRKAALRLRHDLDLIQGTWYRVSSEVDGKKVPMEINGEPIPADSPWIRFVFKGDIWYRMDADGKSLVKMHVIKLDPTRRPKAIDLYILGDDGKPTNDPPIPGIYELEGDTLTLCLNIGGQPEDRPKEFASPPGPRSPWLDVYKRDWTAKEEATPNDSRQTVESGKQKTIRPAIAPPEFQIVPVDSNQALTLERSSDGKTLASAGFDGVVHLWDLHTGKEVGRLRGEKSTIRSIAFAPDGKTVTCVNDAGRVRLWDVASGRLMQSFPGLSESMRLATLNSLMLDAIAFAPDGQRLAVSGFGPTQVEPPDRIYELRVLDAQTGQSIWSHMGRGEQACCLAFAPDGTILARGGWRSVELWDAKTGEPIRALYPTRGTIFALTFTPDGRTLIGGGNIPSQDVNHPVGLVTCWEVATGKILQTMAGHRGGVHAVAVAPDGRTVVSGGDGHSGDNHSEVRLWDISRDQLLWTVQGELGVVRGLAFGPDGQTIVYSDDGNIGLIDVRTGKFQQSLTRTTRRPRPEGPTRREGLEPASRP